MKHYGLIGNPLGHSYSEKYFTEVFQKEDIEADYRLLPMRSLDHLPEGLDGYNVTIPYKEQILPLLDEIDETAQEIGAVNTVYQRKGYNTDWIGFAESIRPLLHPDDTHALVLGSGGAAKAVRYALKKMGITVQTVSRKKQNGAIGYEDLDQATMQQHTIIVNCTPVGMAPQTNQCPNIKYEYIHSAHLLFDCIYNPEQTLFLRKGQAAGARTKNGLEMLHIQAQENRKIWHI